MKKTNKALLLALCAILLVAGSIMGTLAYLTDRKSVENTFSVGKVGITLSETDTDGDGSTVANTYKLIPGSKYTKDPTITVDDASETCYLFVDVRNSIANYIDIAMANGWTNLNGTIWYCEYEQGGNKTFPVFENNSFAVKENADTLPGWSEINTTDSKITVVAYAIQKENMEDPTDAWEKLNNQLNG